ncbi:hypothetical protein OQA88_1689 [Cercophora sp. LCS_1]
MPGVTALDKEPPGSLAALLAAIVHGFLRDPYDTRFQLPILLDLIHVLEVAVVLVRFVVEKEALPEEQRAFEGGLAAKPLRQSTMAVGLDRLERKLDALEKFFRKRRGSGRDAPSQTNTPAAPRKSDSIFRTFPQPSFIRPISSRMMAREEVSIMVRSTQRAHSLPESPSTPRLISLTSQPEDEPKPSSPPTSPRACQPPRIPKRSSSLSPTRRPASLASLAELLEFSFANSSRQRDATRPPLSISRTRTVSISPKAQPDRRRHSEESQKSTPFQRQPITITPPPSAEYDKSFGSLPDVFQKGLPAMPPPSEPTPEPSPRLVPLPDPEVGELDVDERLEITRPRSFDETIIFPKEARIALRESLSFESLAALKASVKTFPILKEPAVSDFLSLSDDDIADDTPAPASTATEAPTCPPVPQPTPPPLALNTSIAQQAAVSKPPAYSLPLDPPVLVASPQITAGTRLLTLSPPLATRPATAAAFEAARIASKYRFDLVYVVNLWPNRMGSISTRNSTIPPPSPSPSTPRPSIDVPPSPTSPTTRTGMTGRLLAAYGLQYVTSPFRISAPVHSKVLRSEGWLEYCSDEDQLEGFSRGYSRSFYTGRSPDGRGQPVDDDADGKPRRRRGIAPNRGVVFAAYRFPRADGTSLASDADELEALGRDAETLVDMLIDIHMTQRQRRPVAMGRCMVGEATAGRNAAVAV